MGKSEFIILFVLSFVSVSIGGEPSIGSDSNQVDKELEDSLYGRIDQLSIDGWELVKIGDRLRFRSNAKFFLKDLRFYGGNYLVMPEELPSWSGMDKDHLYFDVSFEEKIVIDRCIKKFAQKLALWIRGQQGFETKEASAQWKEQYDNIVLPMFYQSSFDVYISSNGDGIFYNGNAEVITLTKQLMRALGGIFQSYEMDLVDYEEWNSERKAQEQTGGVEDSTFGDLSYSKEELFDFLFDVMEQSKPRGWNLERVGDVARFTSISNFPQNDVVNGKGGDELVGGDSNSQGTKRVYLTYDFAFVASMSPEDYVEKFRRKLAMNIRLNENGDTAFEFAELEDQYKSIILPVFHTFGYDVYIVGNGDKVSFDANVEATEQSEQLIESIGGAFQSYEMDLIDYEGWVRDVEG